MSTPTVRLHRWDEIALEKVTEMISRKIVTGERLMSAQVYLKKGALVPKHSHESEQMTYVLQGALKYLIAGEEITVREGEVLHIPSWLLDLANITSLEKIRTVSLLMLLAAGQQSMFLKPGRGKFAYSRLFRKHRRRKTSGPESRARSTFIRRSESG